MAPGLIAFPGRLPPWLVAGVTTPYSADGSLLDLRHPYPGVLASLAGLRPGEWRAAWVSQVHGTRVLRLDAGSGLVGEADGLITNAPRVLLATRHADCPPILLWDETQRAVTLVHSGRKGTFADVAGRAVRRMTAEYGSRPSQLQASLGPGIRPCCYEVREDALRDAPPDTEAFLSRRDGRLYLDLYGMITERLLVSGVGQVWGEDAECTCCGPTRFHSYRRDGTSARFAAVVGIRP